MTEINVSVTGPEDATEVTPRANTPSGLPATAASHVSVSTLRSTVGATAPCSPISRRWRPTRRRCTHSDAPADRAI